MINLFILEGYPTRRSDLRSSLYIRTFLPNPTKKRPVNDITEAESKIERPESKLSMKSHPYNSGLQYLQSSRNLSSRLGHTSCLAEDMAFASPQFNEAMTFQREFLSSPSPISQVSTSSMSLYSPDSDSDLFEQGFSSSLQGSDPAATNGYHHAQIGCFQDDSQYSANFAWLSESRNIDMQLPEETVIDQRGRAFCETQVLPTRPLSPWKASIHARLLLSAPTTSFLQANTTITPILRRCEHPHANAEQASHNMQEVPNEKIPRRSCALRTVHDLRPLPTFPTRARV